MVEHAGHRRGSKQHAYRRDTKAEPQRVLWVYDDEDWELMRGLPSGQLVCPRCRSPFGVPVVNQHGTRFLRDLPGESCSHALSRPELGGGPITAEHRWLMARVARICASIGHPAVSDDFESNCDVYVSDPSYAIEVQRTKTDFRKRTQQHQARGRGVLWLIPHSASGPWVGKTLREQPAVRIKVHNHRDRDALLQPWERAHEARSARLSVYGSVARMNAVGELWTGQCDAREFIAEVMDGRRRWYPRGTPGLPREYSGAWVLIKDLQVVQEQRDALSSSSLSPGTSRVEESRSPLTPLLLEATGTVQEQSRDAASPAPDHILLAGPLVPATPDHAASVKDGKLGIPASNESSSATASIAFAPEQISEPQMLGHHGREDHAEQKVREQGSPIMAPSPKEGGAPEGSASDAAGARRPQDRVSGGRSASRRMRWLVWPMRGRRRSSSR